MSLPDLTTARLALRGLQPGDATAMFRLVNDYSVAGNLARVPFPYREAMARDWIGSTHDQAARLARILHHVMNDVAQELRAREFPAAPPGVGAQSESALAGADQQLDDLEQALLAFIAQD